MAKYSTVGIKHNGYEQTLANYHPLHDGIVIKLHEIKDVTDSGIMIPEAAKQSARSITEDDLAYEVLKVGPECVNVRPGDFVTLGQQTGYPLILKDESGNTKEYGQIFQNWILGVFREGAKPEDFQATDAKVEINNKVLGPLNK
jgi:co-chaperonin GroES (HSP10)